jgi:hypothetical protein
MTKNTKTILLSLLACLLLITGFELGAGRLKFGNATLNDSTAVYITTNKGLIVNGALVAIDTLQTSGLFQAESIEMPGLSGTITFGGYDSYIQEAVDELNFYSDGFNFETSSGAQSLLTLDSASGMGYLIPGVTGYRGSGTLLRQKLIRGITATTVNGAQTYAHGLTNGQIISMTTSVRIDTSGMGGAYGNDVHIYPFANTYMGAGFQYTAWYDSLNVGTLLGGTANAIKGDSVFFILSYIQ